MTQALVLDRPVPAACPDMVTGRGAVRDLAWLTTLFRIPKPGEQMPDDIRRLLEENDLFEEEEQAPRPSAPPAGFAAGMAFCLPALAVIALLYALLK